MESRTIDSALNRTIDVAFVADAWHDFGTGAPVAASASFSPGCHISGCSALAFVELRTSDGRRSLCLAHFSSVKAVLGIS